jgi:hypothetical protein
MPRLPVAPSPTVRLPMPAACCRLLVDGWLLLRIHDGRGPGVLAQVVRLRAGVAELSARRLKAARLSALARVSALVNVGACVPGLVQPAQGAALELWRTCKAKCRACR